MPLSEAASYPLWVNAAIFVAAGVVVWFAGVRLTRHLDAIALRTGMNHAFVGMLLLGGITSLPEVANVANASMIGNPSLAINNLLGSAAINVLLLAVADAWVGRKAVTSIVARPSTMMMATLCMLVLIAIAAAVVLLLAAGGASMPELSTILTALRLHRPEMAFGQVLGTNFINLSLIPLGDALYTQGPAIDELGRFEVISALLGATLIGIFMVGLLEHRDKTIFKMGYDSAAVILMFAVGLGVLATI